MIVGPDNLSMENNVVEDQSFPDDDLLISKREFSDVELSARDPAFTAKYLNIAEMLRMGRVTVNTSSLKKRFDSLFPACAKDWINGLLWASENFARIFSVVSHIEGIKNSDKQRRIFVNDVIREIRTQMHPSDERMIDAVLSSVGFDLDMVRE